MSVGSDSPLSGPETSAERVQASRSALGGFERDAKTFQGHLERITTSADAFVRRCAKFAVQEPGHPRLAETAELLAEAKRICGLDEPAPPTFTAELVGHVAEEDAGGQVRDLQRRVAHLEILCRQQFGDATVNASSEQPVVTVPLPDDASWAEVPAREPTPAPAQGYSLQTLQPEAAARVQAAIDAATAAAAAALPGPAPDNPFAAYFAGQQ